MAAGTTLSIVSRMDKSYKQAVTASDAGAPGAGTVQVIYDDAEPQHALLAALDKARAYIIENHKPR